MTHQMRLRWLAAPLCLATLAAAGSITAQEQQDMLDQHNIYRCMHAVPLFTWDAAIAANAQAHADKGQFTHSSGASRTVNGQQSGENLAWDSRAGRHIDSTRRWYKEIEFTQPYGTADSFTDSTDSSEAIGHYTQVVWKTSVKLGCGKAPVSMSGYDGEMWVCQYGPAGNMGGQFTTHVLAPSKSVGECGGAADDVPAGRDGGGSGAVATTAAPGGGSGAATTAAPGGPVATTAPATTTKPFVAAALPSACVPSEPLPVGGLCVYGYQCASKFCCPRLRVCLASSSGQVWSNQIKVKPADLQSSIRDIVFGGTCRPTSNKCTQTSQGQPLSTWDQTKCGCHADYMTHYQAGTWVTLNDIEGLTCASEQPQESEITSGAAPRAPGAAWPPAALTVCLLALLRA